MGFKSFIKSFPTAKGSQILEGVNYGSGYAGIRDETGKHMVITIQNYLMQFRSIFTQK